MEVHKHPHHVTHKKKWGEYLLEFFMLFLAVFLGFVAENIRESIIERRTEKHYMQSMVQDLQKDTALLNTIIHRTERMTNLLDTVEHILFLEKMNDSLIKKLYGFNLDMFPNILINFTDRTTSQLKNAGGLHLIRNAIVVENLFNYWTRIEGVRNVSENYNDIRIHAREKSYSIFSAKYYNSVPGNNSLLPGVIPKLMTNDKNFLEEFANRIGHLKNGNQTVYIPSLKRIFSAAVKLIELIRKEYHLEKE